MKKYKYNTEFECFERFDENGRPSGKKLWVNITEAQRIVTLYELGNSIGLIQSKMKFNSTKASGSTVKTIINLYENDEIELDGDYPAPHQDYDELDMGGRIDSLENRVKHLENIVSTYADETKKSENKFISKVKSWI